MTAPTDNRYRLWDMMHLEAPLYGPAASSPDGVSQGSAVFIDPRTGHEVEARFEGGNPYRVEIDVNPRVGIYGYADTAFLGNSSYAAGFFLKADLSFNRVTGYGYCKSDADATQVEMDAVIRKDAGVPDELARFGLGGWCAKFEPFFDPVYVAAQFFPAILAGKTAQSLCDYVKLLGAYPGHLDPVLPKMLGDFLVRWLAEIPGVSGDARFAEQLRLNVNMGLLILGRAGAAAEVTRLFTAAGFKPELIRIVDSLGETYYSYGFLEDPDYQSDRNDRTDTVWCFLDLCEMGYGLLEETEFGGVAVNEPLSEAEMARLESEERGTTETVAELVGEICATGVPPGREEEYYRALFLRPKNQGAKVGLNAAQFDALRKAFAEELHGASQFLASAPLSAVYLEDAETDAAFVTLLLAEMKELPASVLKPQDDNPWAERFLHFFGNVLARAVTDARGMNVFSRVRQADPDKFLELEILCAACAHVADQSLLGRGDFWRGLLSLNAPFERSDRPLTFGLFSQCYLRQTLTPVETSGGLWKKLTGLEPPRPVSMTLADLDGALSGFQQQLVKPPFEARSGDVRSFLGTFGTFIFAHEVDLARAALDGDDVLLERAVAQINERFLVPLGYAVVTDDAPWKAESKTWLKALLPVKITSSRVTDHEGFKDVAVFTVRNAQENFPSLTESLREAGVPAGFGLKRSFNNAAHPFRPNPGARRFEGIVISEESVEDKAKMLWNAKKNGDPAANWRQLHPMPELLENGASLTYEDFLANQRESLLAHELAHFEQGEFGYANRELYSVLREIGGAPDPAAILFYHAALTLYKGSPDGLIGVKRQIDPVSGEVSSLEDDPYANGFFYFLEFYARETGMFEGPADLAGMAETDPAGFDAAVRRISSALAQESPEALRAYANAAAALYTHLTFR